MSSKNTTEVILGGKVFKLSGYESEEYLQRVASYINNKLTEFNKDDTNVWDEEIPYEPKILRTILPYGVAGYIYTDDDKAIGTDYKNKYEYAKSQVLAVSLVSIVDVYDETPDEIPILVDDKWSLAEEENNG